MSKIGQVNFDLQEQAEELGFETVQEALDNGYRVFMNIDGTAKLINTKPDAKTIEKYTDAGEMVSPHQQYEHRKAMIIHKLEMLINDTPYAVYRETMQEAIDFIKEKEI